VRCWAPSGECWQYSWIPIGSACGFEDGDEKI
jgi:hypothetical protein